MDRISEPPRLTPRPPDAHKASVGKVLVVGGCRDMCGAPALAAAGALRAGAGLVRIAVPASIQGVVAGLRPEATTAGLAETADGSLAPMALDALDEIVPAWDAVALGPGLGRAGPTRHFARALASATPRPLVLDADGLAACGDEPERLAGREAPTVLTPHEGEAARLLGKTAAEVHGDRETAAHLLAERSGAVVVLKGPGTLVVDRNRVYQNATGGSALASGGTGDVLTGIVAAFLAGLPGTGGDAFGAAVVAVHVHGLAADTRAAKRDRGLIASDVADALPEAVATLVGEKGRDP